jgi:hypothetical protein
VCCAYFRSGGAPERNSRAKFIVVLWTDRIKGAQMHYMTGLDKFVQNEWVKLEGIMGHIRALLDELPLHDEDVRKFMKSINISPHQGTSGWRMGVVTEHPTSFHGILKNGRGNHDKTYDPFYMIHEITLAYTDKHVDKLVRQIASYFESFMFVYREHDEWKQHADDIKRELEKKASLESSNTRANGMDTLLQNLLSAS